MHEIFAQVQSFPVKYSLDLTGLDRTWQVHSFRLSPALLAQVRWFWPKSSTLGPLGGRSRRSDRPARDPKGGSHTFHRRHQGLEEIEIEKKPNEKKREMHDGAMAPAAQPTV